MLNVDKIDANEMRKRSSHAHGWLLAGWHHYFGQSIFHDTDRTVLTTGHTDLLLQQHFYFAEMEFSARFFDYYHE